MPKLSVPSKAAACLLSAATQCADAAIQQPGDYSAMGGFGTLGGVKTNSDGRQYGHDRQPGGADGSLSFNVDSDLGVRLTGTATRCSSPRKRSLPN